MKVLLLTPSIRPLGARRSLVELVRHLPAHVEPLIICPQNDGIALELRDLGAAVEIAPQGAWRKWSGRLTALFRQIPQIERCVERFRPDVIHANEFHIVPQAFRGGEKKSPLSPPLCSHVRLSITPRQILTYDMAACRRIVAVSESVANLFAGSALSGRVRVVYNGVNTGMIAAEGPGLASADPLRQDPSLLVCGLFGLISGRKNQLVAAEAVAAARARGAKVALLLAGDAFKTSQVYGEELRTRLKAPDLSGSALWLPFQSDIAALYRSIDVNLLISSEEGFGRTIIEAGAAGRPSIGTRIGGIPELIQEGRTGWLVKEENVEELADALVEAWQDREKTRRLGAAAKRLAEERFTIQAHVRAMIGVWEEALGEGR